jgi:hypothetical protein
MADLSVSNTFVAGTPIESAKVNTNFSDIVTWLNNKYNAVDSWVNLTTTGTIKIANGTASAPSLAFSASTNLGLFRQSADTVALAAGGQPAFRCYPGSFTYPKTEFYGNSVTIGVVARSTDANDLTRLYLNNLGSTATSDCSIRMDNAGTGDTLITMWNPKTTSTNYSFGIDDSDSKRFKLQTGVAIDGGAFFLADSAGTNVGILTPGNATNFQSGVGVIFIGNRTTVPTGNPTGGGFLYVDAGALKYRGTSGTVTTVGPA